MTWQAPWALYGLILIPLLAALYVWREGKHPAPTVVFPGTSKLRPLVSPVRRWLRHLPVVLRLAGLAFLIVALARPQLALEEEKISTEGIDIVLTLDISSSMLARDLQPDRITAAKKVASEFVAGRQNDRIGLVMFAGQSYTWCPLTMDYAVLEELLGRVEAGAGHIEDGTGIGKAIATGTNRLRESNAKSKVLILLTDGVNNVDQPDPLTATRAAQALGVKIYTIGVGSRGTAPAPVQSPRGGIQFRNMQVEIDEELLKKIADMTGGMYFRATSTESLRDIYNQIDRLEKTEMEIEHMRRWEERFTPYALIALILLLLERLLTLTWLRNLAT